MRTGRCWVLFVGVVGSAMVAQAVGCDTTPGETIEKLMDPSTVRDAGLDADGGHPHCDPTVSAVTDACGVFVSSSLGSDTTGKGTMKAPYQTLGHAIAAAKGQAVYACGETFTEAITLSTGVTMYGALACSQAWTYDPSKKTQLSAPADAIPLTLASTASGTAIHDFAIVAADATKPGGSSIAVLDQAGVTLEDVDVTAGKGAAGAAGAAQAAVVTPATAHGQDGTPDTMCTMAGPIAGGNGGKNACGSTNTNGGIGGSGVAAPSGGQGTGGLPTMTPSNAGAGQTMTSCQLGGAGGQGSDGAQGMPGTGARGIGQLSTTGHAGPMGTSGTAGSPGQGGGGGGGAAQCDTMGNFAGPSGGGGGAGGCGGMPGNAGQSGGSSIGIVALGVTPILKTGSITTHDGGAGGTGGDGQLGGAGGQPGMAGGAAACGGGLGGKGGAGGPGGGGAGGHSVAVAVSGGARVDLSGTLVTLGHGAVGGPGGNMDMTAQTKGDDGKACKTLDFTTGSAMPCGM